ncbi:hypothetical protein OJAV_G00157960 [Oryzias javanicus]|uniref:Uncharacterized protein n=1 Tax=Oryzias javanicus TaxID=123683 RepID=A0A3S2PJE8_ORYJA|nr:hypothetical protein OJAV_G00157960 [Oryzias javanicus]
MRPGTQMTHKMDFKVSMATLVLFLFIMLKVSWAQTTIPVTQNTPVRNITVPLLQFPQKEAINSVKNTTLQASTKGTSTPSPTSTTRSVTRGTYDPKWDKDFKYDYESLRYAG